MSIELLFEKENRVFCLKSFEKELLKLSEDHRKKVMSWIVRLKERFPNKPEMWKPLKGEGCEKVFELKPKPFRICCLVIGNNILLIDIWRVQKGRSKQKSQNIAKCCKQARRLEDVFKRVIR